MVQGLSPEECRGLCLWWVEQSDDYPSVRVFVNCPDVEMSIVLLYHLRLESLAEF